MNMNMSEGTLRVMELPEGGSEGGKGEENGL